MGVGVYKTLMYEGIKVRFFADSEVEYNKLYEITIYLFIVFKFKITQANSIPVFNTILL